MLPVCLAGPEPKPDMKGDTRTFRVWLDPNQYQLDMTKTMDGHEVNSLIIYAKTTDMIA